MAKDKKQAKKLNALGAENKWAQFIPFGLFVFALLLYANTLNHGYVLDDISVISENRYVNSGVDGIGQIWTTSYRDGYWNDSGTLYRPIALTIFAIEWQLAPNNPFLAHLINVLLYGFLCLLFYKLLLALFKNAQLALIATLFFCATAIHTEVVANIKSLDEILSMLLAMLSWYFVLKWQESQKMQQLIIAGLCFMIGMVTKEGIISFIAIIPASLWFFRNEKLKAVFTSMAILLGAAISYIAVRASVLGSIQASIKPASIDNPIVNFDLADRFFTSMKLLGLYIQKLVVPHPLAYEYAFNTIEKGSTSDPLSWFGILLFIALIAGVFWGLKTKSTWSFLAFSFLASMALYLNLVIIIGAMFAERFLFLATVFWAIALAMLLQKISQKQFRFAISAFVVASLSVLTIQRNPVWQSNYSLYAADIETLETSCKAHYNLGLELMKNKAVNSKTTEDRTKYLHEAKSEFLKALEIKPGYGLPKGQIALVYYRLGDMQESITRYEAALTDTPTDEQAWNNLASAYFTTQQYDQAKRCFMKAVELNPYYADALGNLGAINGMQGNHQEAIAFLKRALEIKPNVATYYKYIGMSLQALGNEAEAQKYYQMFEAKK
jgi:tetratricopeptide (TPR) repeat protein